MGSLDEPTGRGESRLKAGIILVGDFVHRPEEVVETEIMPPVAPSMIVKASPHASPSASFIA
jgi:hypothetical protein